jgi:sodium-dependent dicarboxylate transporter 2/3/5
VVFGSGHIRIGQLIRAGIWANLAGAAITMLVAYTVVRVVFGIELGVMPEWAVAR